MTTIADRIVNVLAEAGVRALFGVPGGAGNLDLIAAAGRAGMPFVLTATETAGAIAALAQAEITGRPGVCLTTIGPGAASVVNGLACAYLDRAPLLVVHRHVSGRVVVAVRASASRSFVAVRGRSRRPRSGSTRKRRW